MYSVFVLSSWSGLRDTLKSLVIIFELQICVKISSHTSEPDEFDIFLIIRLQTKMTVKPLSLVFLNVKG